MSSPKNRHDLEDALLTAGREGSTLTVIFHSAIAERLGLSVSDYKTLDLILRKGSLTAGKLGELTGLTTGAVTGLIDRLERAGLVRRERDEQDRRKVIVQPVVSELEQNVLPMFGSFGAALGELYAGYSDEELLTILDYTTRLNDVLKKEIKKLRENIAGEERPVKTG